MKLKLENKREPTCFTTDVL